MFWYPNAGVTHRVLLSVCPGGPTASSCLLPTSLALSSLEWCLHSFSTATTPVIQQSASSSPSVPQPPVSLQTVQAIKARSVPDYASLILTDELVRQAEAAVERQRASLAHIDKIHDRKLWPEYVRPNYLPWECTRNLPTKTQIRRRMKFLVECLELEKVHEIKRHRKYPNFQVGDILDVTLAVPENERKQYVYRGVCIQKTDEKDKMYRTAFKIYNVFPGSGGVIQHFPLYMPDLLDVKIVGTMPALREQMSKIDQEYVRLGERHRAKRKFWKELTESEAREYSFQDKPVVIG